MLKGRVQWEQNVVGRGVECGIFEENKIGKIPRKIEMIDLIGIGIMTLENWDVFGMVARGCEFWQIFCNKNCNPF